jgi:hypothetical protein
MLGFQCSSHSTAAGFPCLVFLPAAPSSRPLEEVLEQVVIQYMVMSEAYATCRIKLAGLDMYPEVWL